jgi:hypothetical protein
MYYTFFFNVYAVVCQNNSQFQVWELNICQFIVIVEIKYFLNLNEYHLPIFILSIHFKQISFFKITKDIQSNNNNNIVLSMLYAEICPKVRRNNARPEFITWTTQYYCIKRLFLWNIYLHMNFKEVDISWPKQTLCYCIYILQAIAKSLYIPLWGINILHAVNISHFSCKANILEAMA